jgi:hypothetical protein
MDGRARKGVAGADATGEAVARSSKRTESGLCSTAKPRSQGRSNEATEVSDFLAEILRCENETREMLTEDSTEEAGARDGCACENRMRGCTDVTETDRCGSNEEARMGDITMVRIAVATQHAVSLGRRGGPLLGTRRADAREEASLGCTMEFVFRLRSLSSCRFWVTTNNRRFKPASRAFLLWCSLSLTDVLDEKRTD